MEYSSPAFTAIINLHILPTINFALQQNHVPAIRQLILTNTSADDWQQVIVSITSEPGFASYWEQTIESLKTGESFEFGNISLRISSQYLAELTEKVAGCFTLSVTSGDVVICKEQYPVEVLAYDQWNGLSLLPEMLAAFITPNHPQIPVIIRQAAMILEKWTGSPSFDEYQSRNPDRVRKQMAAIYEAIAEMQLIYCTVPASFEESGQRVRLADAIFSNRLANCLDLSLLYAACLEAVGIHPIIVIVKGHAFAGAWLIDESFADAVNDDPSLITKRTADGISEMVVVEAVCMNAGQNVTFDDAVRAADRRVLKTEDFVLFIDLKRARFSGIRPIPLRIATAGGWKVEELELKDRENLLPEDIYTGPKLVYTEKIEVTKQRLWERKLLDLTLRNSLLNVRITKSVIQFMTINVASLEDALANGDEFQVLARPSDWDNLLRDTGLYQALHQSDPVADLVKHELSHRRIRTYLPEADLHASLTNVYRSSRLSLEENGANTLYIGLGLLKWYETAASQRPRYAPILLVPVEIIRKSAQKGFVIRSREEEIIMNITLLEMIRQYFGTSIVGLEILPKDESGVDVKAVFNIMRQAVMSQARWDVEEQAILGTFSFSKFILWNDIHHNADALCKNKVVASLMSGKLEWQATDNAAVMDILDGQLHPADIALPISTDSSQLQAIVSSGQNKSFVLHGPPGTGKSQTITNIIANALYSGKRVLFVASKKAALDVVEKRLESIGIGPFCLELHSNKSKKSAVLEQLKRATLAAKKMPPANYREEADRLFALRNELNLYVLNLHRQYPFGYSLFDLFTKYSQLPKAEDVVFFKPAVFDSLTKLQLTAWHDLVAEIQTVGIMIGNPAEHPLNQFNVKEYSTQLKQEAKQQLEWMLNQLQQLETISSAAFKILKLEEKAKQQSQEVLQLQLSRLVLSLPDIPASLMRAENPEQSLAQLIGIAAHGKKRDALRSELLLSFRIDILSFPASQTLTAWNIASGKWFLPRLLKQNSLLKDLKLCSLTGSINKQQVPGLLQQVMAYQEEQVIIEKASSLPALLGFLWQNGDADWDKIASASETLIQANRLAMSIVGTSQVKTWRHQLASEFEEGSQAFTVLHNDTLQAYIKAYEQLLSTMEGVKTLIGIEFESINKTVADWKTSLGENCRKWLLNLDLLKDWYNWINVKERALKSGLQPLVTAFENGTVSASAISLQYQKGLFRSAAEYIIANNPQLSTFNSSIFSEKISRFREISRQYETLTRQELYARLVAKIPSFTQEASQSSEIGILQKAISSKRPIPIRKLFDQIPNLLPRLTPCMLMSPISVAQYFEADAAKFDLVIFDEASQMPTCEAVGAIARGSNVIVVGDPKQMPPTNFFSSNNVDEDNIEKEDLESILDDCLALSMPSQYLLWHYRSKHESLIAFSNAKYYDNKLLTFPSTDDIKSKVYFVPVEGFYDKGKTRQNRFEAKAIVDEVVSRLSDPLLSQKSIGIVTFSSVQQILIEDLLNEVFVTRPDLEKIAFEREEPIFIKNLENVQGDERDVILFSVGYGPDEEGKVSLNFGPINRDGGWRRLNVAVSRARFEMKVFSTLRSDQINLNRTGSEGVAGLKAFLAYAEKGKSVLPIRLLSRQQDYEGFENSIAQEIRRYGYEVHTNIGCSDYRIDIAIVDPQHPSEYILGVLTDGKNYFNATTSKDREVVQVEVLAMLGWQIHKIWSTEWWEHPARVLQGILEAIRKAEENRQQELVIEAVKEPLVPLIQEAIASKPASANIEESHYEIPETNSVAVPYEVTYLPIQGTAFAEDFFGNHNMDKIKKQVFAVIEMEAPISRNLLCKRVLTAWGISRIGSRISSHFDRLFAQMHLTIAPNNKTSFFWKNKQHQNDFNIFRIAKNEFEKRDAEDLPPEEVANAVNAVLKNQISLSKNDLIRETAKLFGYSRVGGNVEMSMKHGIDKAIELGYANTNIDRITYAL